MKAPGSFVVRIRYARETILAHPAQRRIGAGGGEWRAMRSSVCARPVLAAALLTSVLSLGLVGSAAGQATRTWVSGVGDDLNPCSRTAPCKTLAGAISKTAAGGEINAIDSAGYGTLTITKAITIDFAGVHGSVLNSGVTGFTVNAGAADDVVLRNLSINGVAPVAVPPPDQCQFNGLHGIRVLNARSVLVEDVTIARQRTAGITVAPTATDPQVLVHRSTVGDVCGPGVDVAPGPGRRSSVMVSGGAIQGTAVAVRVADGGTATVTGTSIFGNALGLQALGTGVLSAYADARLFGNLADGAPTQLLSAGTQGPPGPAGPPGPQGAAGEPALKLLLAPLSSSLAGAAGRPVSLGYVATMAAAATLTVVRGGRTVATVRGTARTGRNAIRWSARRSGRPAPTGAYKLMLRLTAADGQTTTSSVKLKLVGRRPAARR
jgi:hypothetical protein